MIDVHGRMLDHLRISVTDRCNMACRYCKPAGGGCGPTRRRDLLTVEEFDRIVTSLVRDFGVTHLRLTGGEPTVWPDLEALVRRLNRLPVADIAMTTNATLLARDNLAARLREAGLRRLNISLDSLRAERLDQISPSTRLEDVLAGIAAARAAGFAQLKFNAVLMRGINDDEIEALIRFAAAQGGVMRFIELMPIGVMAASHGRWVVPAAAVRQAVAENFSAQLAPRPAGSPAQEYELTDRRNGAQMRYGVIASETEPFCDSCRRLRLTAEGRLIACLFQEGGVELRSWLAERFETPLASRQSLGNRLRTAIAEKPMRRNLTVQHPMHVVGG